MLRSPLALVFSLLLVAFPAWAEEPVAADKDPVLLALEGELKRALEELGKKDKAPYFIGLQVIESGTVSVVGEEGAIQGYSPMVVRVVAADVRVGDPRLDSTHPLREAVTGVPIGVASLPLGEDPEVLGREIWSAIDSAYEKALDRWQEVESDRKLLVEEELSWDLAPTDAERELHPQVSLAGIDLAAWEDAARKASAAFGQSDLPQDPSVSLFGSADTRWFVSSEGHRLRDGQLRLRATASVDSQAEDGTMLSLFRSWDSADADGLPSADELRSGVLDILQEIDALREAPEQGPYRGPALLSGGAAAVFFHEIFGHRVEGHRLKQVTDAQTFRSQVGEAILPSFLSVHDDPTLQSVGGVDLRGFYRFDDEGTRAQRVTLVDSGVLRGFLEGRSPVGEEGRSNGHGRRQAGSPPVSRQGNLLVEASETVSDEVLRARLIAAAKSEGLDYGLVIDEIGGGFTFTDRDLPNAFQIDVMRGRRVYVDGRPDEIVRGIDLIGTPLASFSKIVAAGSTPEVFNGTCGAESGWVPVAAVSPALLISQIETQRKSKGQQRPPLTPPPGPSGKLAAEVATRNEGETLADNFLVSVLVSELERAKDNLQMPGLPSPSRLSAMVADGEAHHFRASFGELVLAQGAAGRPGRVEVIVGDDSINSVRISGESMGGLPDSKMNPRFVLGEEALPVARDLWITADASYKAALGRYGAKLALRRKRAEEEAPPDWTAAPAVVYDSNMLVPAVDREALSELAKEASTAFRPFGDRLRHGEVRVMEVQGEHVLVDTDGMRIVQPEGYAVLFAYADIIREDGLRLYDRRVWLARSAAELPSLARIQADLEDLSISLLLRAEAPTVDYYEGPVVFEDEAAADVFRYMLPPELRGTPPEPSAERTYQQQTRGGPRIGRRLLPRGWAVSDDPASIPDHLAGGFAYDREGVAPKKVELIVDGYVRDLVMSRTPRADRRESNGRARGGLDGPIIGRLSGWKVQPKRMLGEVGFRRSVQAARRAADQPAVLVVRRMEQGWEGRLPRPTDAVWRFADGSELPVPAIEFEDVDKRTLRGIEAAGGGMQTYAYMASHSGWGRASPTAGLPMVLQAPRKLLIGEMALVFPGGKTHKPQYPQPVIGVAPGAVSE